MEPRDVFNIPVLPIFDWIIKHLFKQSLVRLEWTLKSIHFFSPSLPYQEGISECKWECYSKKKKKLFIISTVILTILYTYIIKRNYYYVCNLWKEIVQYKLTWQNWSSSSETPASSMKYPNFKLRWISKLKSRMTNYRNHKTKILRLIIRTRIFDIKKIHSMMKPKFH